MSVELLSLAFGRSVYCTGMVWPLRISFDAGVRRSTSGAQSLDSYELREIPLCTESPLKALSSLGHGRRKRLLKEIAPFYIQIVLCMHRVAPYATHPCNSPSRYPLALSSPITEISGCYSVLISGSSEDHFKGDRG